MSKTIAMALAAGITLGAIVMALWRAPAEARAMSLGSLPSAQDRNSDDGDQTRRAARRTPVVDVFEQARDAVVNISSTEVVRVRSPFGRGSIFDEIFDMPTRQREYTRTSVGSGFVLHEDGYIVTNAHVVSGTVDRKVIFAGGDEYEAEIVALDTSVDLAILKIDAPTRLITLPLGRSDDLMIGETVIAIGNPLGFAHTVTAGVVSATNRDLDFDRGIELKGLIQTDASINLGNSGGPLLNVLGELIGINTALRGDAQNIGFAIPVNQLRANMRDLLDVERRHGFLTGLALSANHRPVIEAVRSDSPAAEAGLRQGDLLRAVDGKPITQSMDLDFALIGQQPGERVRLQVEREGRLLDRTLRLASRPAPDGTLLARQKLGIEVAALSQRDAERLGLRSGRGLMIAEVLPDSPAARVGLRQYDVLEGIDRRTVGSVDELGELLEYVEAGDSVDIYLLRVERGRKYRLQGPIRTR